MSERLAQQSDGGNGDLALLDRYGSLIGLTRIDDDVENEEEVEEEFTDLKDLNIALVDSDDIPF